MSGSKGVAPAEELLGLATAWQYLSGRVCNIEKHVADALPSAPSAQSSILFPQRALAVSHMRCLCSQNRTGPVHPSQSSRAVYDSHRTSVAQLLVDSFFDSLQSYAVGTLSPAFWTRWERLHDAADSTTDSADKWERDVCLALEDVHGKVNMLNQMVSEIAAIWCEAQLQEAQERSERFLSPGAGTRRRGRSRPSQAPAEESTGPDASHVEHKLTTRLHLILQAAFFSCVPPSFAAVLYRYFELSFACHCVEVTGTKNADGKEQDNEEEEEEEEEEEDGDDEKEEERDVSASVSDPLAVVKRFADVCRCLREMRWLGVSEQVFSEMLFVRIRHHVEKNCKGRLEEQLLHSTLAWVHRVVFPWITLLLSGAPESGETPLADADAGLNQWKTRLDVFAHERFGELRISELFDIIVEYPDSMPALHDIRECLQVTSLHTFLISSLNASITKRLLQPGANTVDIVTQYISTIKALRFLDSKGVVLEAVAGPIKAYLSRRSDTVRCIVSRLTDSSAGEDGTPNELMEELEACAARGGSQSDEDGEDDDSDNDDAEAGVTEICPPVGGGVVWLRRQRDSQGNPTLAHKVVPTPSLLEPCAMEQGWEPDPVDVDPSKTSRSRRNADIISMLIGIYGTKDVFAEEYKQLLCERLLGATTYDNAKETGHLELLKVRFGESRMQDCEVMLKDVTNSRRVNAHVQSMLMGAATPGPSKTAASQIDSGTLTPEALFGVSFAGPSSPRPEKKEKEQKWEPDSPPAEASGGDVPVAVEALMISKEFWPALPSYESFDLPPHIQRRLDEYGKCYARMKANRQLHWENGLGVVDIDLQLEDRHLSFKVPPLQAAIIDQFDGDVVQAEEDEADDVASDAVSLSLEELASRLGMSESDLRPHMSFWVSRYVLAEGKGPSGQLCYTVIESLANRKYGGAVLDFDEEDDAAAFSADTLHDNHMAGLHAYVMGIVTDFQGQPLTKIHNMLKMFTDARHSYRATEQQLEEYLNRLVQEGQLECASGLYKRVKRQNPQ